MSIKSIVGLITAAGLVATMGAMCIPGTTTPTATPTKAPTATAVATATVAPTAAPTTLLSATLAPYLVADDALPYYSGYSLDDVGLTFTPVAGKPVTVTVMDSITANRISIDVGIPKTPGTTGGGTYTTNGVPNSNTTVLTFTPPSNGSLSVYPYEWYPSTSTDGGTLTVTVTQ